MKKVTRFEDFKVWKKAKALTVDIYEELKENNDFGFRNQLQEASVSVMNNIAEGYERRSNKEFSRFLYISKGSTGEVRSMLHVARGLGYISKGRFEVLYKQSVEISKMLTGLIKSME